MAFPAGRWRDLGIFHGPAEVRCPPAGSRARPAPREGGRALPAPARFVACRWGPGPVIGDHQRLSAATRAWALRPLAVMIVRVGQLMVLRPATGGSGGRPPGLRPVFSACDASIRLVLGPFPLKWRPRLDHRLGLGEDDPRAGPVPRAPIPSGTSAPSAASANAINSATSAFNRASSSQACFHDCALRLLADLGAVQRRRLQTPARASAAPRRSPSIVERRREFGAWPRHRITTWARKRGVSAPACSIP